MYFTEIRCDQAPTYRERGETLVEDIKHRFLNDMKDSCSDAADDLIRRLQMVDIIECLGIDRHFQPEIKEAIDYVYRLSITHEFDFPFIGFSDCMHL